jgi:hypothetical protein
MCNSSLVNHTGFFTTLPTYSYHALQSFFNATEIAELVNQTALEIASKNLSAFQQLQANIQLEWLKEGVVGQIELALFTGELLFCRIDRHSTLM